MKKALIYSKDNCTYCVKAKNLLKLQQIPYTESFIGKDISRDDFISLFPEHRTMPLIFIDGEKIGGYDDLLGYLKRNA
jgi:glutaredoxin 3